MDCLATTPIDLLFNFGVGIIGSGVASFLFLRYVLFNLRPKIIICTEIAEEKDDKDITWFWFKIINKSNYSGFDLNFKLEQRQMEPCAEGCYHINFQELQLKKDSFAHIPRHLNDKEILKTKIAPHCFQVRTKENVRLILKDKLQSLHFQVTLRHGLTGLSDSFEHSFTKESEVKVGSFAFGNQTVIE